MSLTAESPQTAFAGTEARAAVAMRDHALAVVHAFKGKGDGADLAQGIEEQGLGAVVTGGLGAFKHRRAAGDPAGRCGQ